jgi:hypothetical protein
MALLGSNDVLGVMLELVYVLGIVCHVRPTTVVVDLIEVASLIHVSRPLWVGAVQDGVQRDGHAHHDRQIL